MLDGSLANGDRYLDHFIERTVQTLMEGFETEAAMLAKFSVFNAMNMTVDAEFQNEDDFL